MKFDVFFSYIFNPRTYIHTRNKTKLTNEAGLLHKRIDNLLVECFTVISVSQRMFIISITTH